MFVSSTCKNKTRGSVTQLASLVLDTATLWQHRARGVSAQPTVCPADDLEVDGVKGLDLSPGCINHCQQNNDMSGSTVAACQVFFFLSLLFFSQTVIIEGVAVAHKKLSPIKTIKSDLGFSLYLIESRIILDSGISGAALQTGPENVTK